MKENWIYAANLMTRFILIYTTHLKLFGLFLR